MRRCTQSDWEAALWQSSSNTLGVSPGSVNSMRVTRAGPLRGFWSMRRLIWNASLNPFCDQHDLLHTHASIHPFIIDSFIQQTFAEQLREVSHTSKATLKILQARLQQYMNWELLDVQVGFRIGRGTGDQITNMHWIIKAREFQKNIYFCFIDYAKAFDCVDHNKLWKIL